MPKLVLDKPRLVLDESKPPADPNDIGKRVDDSLDVAVELEISLINAEEIADARNGEKIERPGLLKRGFYGFVNKAFVQPFKNIQKYSTFGELDTQMEALTEIRRIKEETGREVDSSEIPEIFVKAKARVNQRIQGQLPSLQTPPAEGVAEKGVEIVTGVGAFVTKLAIARKFVGGSGAVAEIAAFEVVNLVDDGTPGMGVLLASSLGLVGKIPAATNIGKVGKLAGQGGVLAGITAAEGGDPEDIAVSFFLPMTLGALKQFPHLVRGKGFEAKIAKEIQSKGFTVKDSKSIAKSVRDAAEVRGGNMTPKQWGARHGKNLNDIRSKYNKAVDTVTKRTTPLATVPKAVAKQAVSKQTKPAKQITPKKAKAPQKPSEAKQPTEKPVEPTKPVAEGKGIELDKLPEGSRLSVTKSAAKNSVEGAPFSMDSPASEFDVVTLPKNPTTAERKYLQSIGWQQYSREPKRWFGPSRLKAEKAKPVVKLKVRSGHVDLTPLAEAGEQIKTTGEKAAKVVTRFGGLEPKVKKSLIEYEEQVRELPKAIAKDAIEKFGKLTTEQERAIENHRENPKKYDLPDDLKPHLETLEKGIEEYGKRLEALGYPADWPNTYKARLEKMLEKEQAKKEPNQEKIGNIQTALKEAEGLQYLHHYYQKTSAGKRLWARFKRSISKKPTGVLGRQIPTYEKAEELGLKRAPLAVSYAHMAHEIARAEMANDLITAINENPNLSLPEDKAPDDWVRLDERIFPASVQHQAWVEEGKPRHKRTYRKYPIPIAEALQEITYSRGNEMLERGYDKLNFGLKIIGFYNPFVMTKNDAVQLWRAAGFKGFAPLVLPEVKVETGQLGINPPKAVQIWTEKGAEYEKLRKGGLFNNVVNYTPAVTEITEQMLNHIRETSGEKAARIIGESLNPANLLKNLRKFNDMTTWNMDEIMRIACYEAVKDSPMLMEMSDSEKIEWVNDAMVNYAKMPKSTKRWLSKGIFVPTYRAGNFRYFWGEASRVYQGQWRHLAPIVRTVAYKMFVQWGLPAIVAAAILYKTGEKRDVRTEKGYRLVVHNPETNTDTVYALSDPLLEGAKLTQRTLRHTLALNLAPIPSLIVRVSGGPRFKQSNDPFGEFFKLGTPVYRDVLNWKDKDKTVPQKILTQMAIAFVYTRRGREQDKTKTITALAKALSIWTDWKEQASDLKKMVSGRSYYLGPGGKFGRLFRQFNMEQDIDRSEIDENLDNMIAKGDYEGAVKLAFESERYETEEGIAGRIALWRAPLYYYWGSMSKKDRDGFRDWLRENKHYSDKEISELVEALEKSEKDISIKKE